MSTARVPPVPTSIPSTYFMDFAASAVERDSLAEVQTRPEFHNSSNPRAWATVSVVVRFKHWRNYAQPSDWGTQYLAAFSRNGLVRPKPPDGSTRTTHECSNWPPAAGQRRTSTGCAQ